MQAVFSKSRATSSQVNVKRVFDLLLNDDLIEASNVCGQGETAFPGNSSWIHLHGLIAARMGRHTEAYQFIRKSIALSPDVGDFHANLGMLLGQSGRIADAIKSLRRAIDLNAKLPAAWRNLGLAFSAAGRMDEALDAFSHAARLSPDEMANWRDVAVIALGLGEAETAWSAMRNMGRLQPSHARLHGELLLTMQYIESMSSGSILEASRQWAREFASFDADSVHFENDPTPDRRIRLAYVSGDFRDHPIGRLIWPILAHHDHSEFEVVCYSDVSKADFITEQIQASADAWFPIAEDSDEQLANRIRGDKIDILVDLTGHMQMQRLPVFARKPAPVQVSYLGYPATTGIAAIDYRLTDIFHDPPGENDDAYVEKLIRLPRCCWCYQAQAADCEIDPNDLPPGPPVFGCMNRLAKTTPRWLQTWSRILASLPGARMLVLIDAGFETAVAGRFAAAGIDPARMDFALRGTRQNYLSTFSRVWVHLDTFPYNGHTTTCDGLFMGVPTVSMAGKTHVQRAGCSVLGAVGLDSLVASTPDEYVEIAVELASDQKRLTDLRRTLRTRVEQSPLGDGQSLARSIESSLRAQWRHWCAMEANREVRHVDAAC